MTTGHIAGESRPPPRRLRLMTVGAGQRDHVTPGQRAGWPVALVSMPFMHVDRPSIQLGLLAAIGRAHGFPVRTLHANLDFAARIGVDQYRRLAEHRGPLVGDWLFSVEAFGAAAPDPAAELPHDLAAELSYLGAPPDALA